MLLAPYFALDAQELSIGPDDIRIEQPPAGGGYHLFVRKKPGIASIMLTETTRDPQLNADNYAYRAQEWNPVNGDEMRILDGAPITPERPIYFLIDSTPEPHAELGEAFNIFVPYILVYGYPDSRYGEVYMADGTYCNIRSFALPYGDYRGAFQDNPYTIRIVQKPSEGPPDNYMKDTEEAFKEIAEKGKGELVYSKGPEDLVDKIREIIEREEGDTLDLTLCLDTTSSMKNDIDAVRAALIPMLNGIIERFQSFRIGLALYKDYFDEYLVKIIPFTQDFSEFRRTLNGIRVSGGRDIPEAVYEALYEGATKFPWMAESRLIILIGDAPPHPRPRGRVTRDMLDEVVERRNLRVHAIILPN